MNGHQELPTLTFGDDQTYEILDSILNGQEARGRDMFGWAVRVWCKQGVIIVARWGGTSCPGNEGDWVCRDKTSLLAWSDEKQDYTNEISVLTDDITRIEVV